MEVALGSSAYDQYAEDLSTVAASVATSPWEQIEAKVHTALNGQASGMLRALVPLEFRRSQGAFFTSGAIRDRFSAHLAQTVDIARREMYWDPTCGAGDLLLAASDSLPLGKTLSETLKSWGRRLCGHDTQASFVRVARLRLFLAAAARHRARGDVVRMTPQAGIRYFARVQVGDGLAALRESDPFRGHLLLNPPFGAVHVDNSCDWSTGMTSQAAIFFLAAAERLARGHLITAILPDVLRSGTRYEGWRNRVSSLLGISAVAIHGQFDDYADVDVFLLQGSRRQSVTSDESGPLWWRVLRAEFCVGDVFDVRVGPVVDNRDPCEGPEVPFLTARVMPVEGEMQEPQRRRRYNGRLLTPPFVAVRRTSRPTLNNGPRIRGVLVTGTRPVAIDNHLITLKPKGGGIEQCITLLEILESSDVTVWLDERIRCRHMTVGVVRSIPWH